MICIGKTKCTSEKGLLSQQLNQALLLSTKLKIPREQNMVFRKFAICVISNVPILRKKYKYVASFNPGPILASLKTIFKQISVY